MSMKKCKYCGAMTEVVAGFWPVVCDSDECNEEARQEELERADAAREAAYEDGFALYGGPGPDHF